METCMSKGVYVEMGFYLLVGNDTLEQFTSHKLDETVLAQRSHLLQAEYTFVP